MEWDEFSQVITSYLLMDMDTCPVDTLHTEVFRTLQIFHILLCYRVILKSPSAKNQVFNLFQQSWRCFCVSYHEQNYPSVILLGISALILQTIWKNLHQLLLTHCGWDCTANLQENSSLEWLENDCTLMFNIQSGCSITFLPNKQPGERLSTERLRLPLW